MEEHFESLFGCDRVDQVGQINTPRGAIRVTEILPFSCKLHSWYPLVLLYYLRRIFKMSGEEESNGWQLMESDPGVFTYDASLVQLPAL